MVRVVRMAAAAAMAAGVVAGAAQAQPAQTPEGAAAFLKLLVAQGTTKVDVNGGAGWNAVSGTRKVNKCVGESYSGGLGYRTRCFDQDTYSQVSAPSRALLSAASERACETRFAFADYRDGDYAGVWKIGPSGYSAAILDWGKVAKVAVYGSTVEVSPSQPALRFVLPSEDVAKRVGYAMEFLRQNCDPTATTGF